MKCSELQIGDYVRFKRTKEIVWVFEIDGDRNVINNEPDGYCSEKNIAVDDVEPIPLTPEMLEKNGFEYKDAWAEWWHRSEDGFESDFQLGITESGFSMKDIGNAKINFVHQLQHALRLCGLNDLADSLKLEE